jgi:hypothetical protein
VIKFVKLLLPTVGLLLLFAVAPGSASATQLCSAFPCSMGAVYPIGTKAKMVEVVGTPAEFITELTTTKCGEDVGTFETTVAGTPLQAKITGLTFSECLTGCPTVTAINLPWAGNITAIAGGNGTMTAEGSSLGVKLSGCPGMVTCTLTTKKIEFSITGGIPALVRVKVALAGTAPCGSSVWTSTFKVVSPPSLFVE